MKQPNGYGGISKLKGRRRKPYAVRVTTGWTDEGKQIKKYLGYYATRREAIKALADYNENPFDLKESDAKFSEIYDRWTEKKYNGERPAAQCAACYNWFEPLHDKPFFSLRRKDLQACIDSCPRGAGTKQHMKSLVNQMYVWCIENELTNVNHAITLHVPAETRSEMHKPFSASDIDTLWANKEDHIAKLALILIYTGMRPAELMQMKNEDVHMEERYMRGGVKTEASKNRIIPIAEKIAPLISSLYDASQLYLVEAPRTSDALCKRFKYSALIKSLSEPHLPHDGRHTCATLLDNADVPLKIQQLILGHASKTITRRVYTHKTLEQLLEAINRI